MPKNNENFNKELEGFLRAQGIKKIATLDTNGEAVPDSKHADQFKFHYRNGDFDYGTVTVTTDDGKVTVYFNESVVRDPERGIDTNWTKFLMKLKDWSLRNGQMGFQVRNLDELGNQMRKRQIQKEEEKLLEGYYGTKHTSYNDNNPKIKMIIKHNKALDENDQRFRYIDKIFLENEVGERLLVPTKKPSVGRAFARHLAEGGEYNDDRWKHIYEIAEDLGKLSGFVRATKSNQFNESVMQIVNEATEHYLKLKETLHKIQGSRGYHQYFESYKPSIMENDVEHDYSNMFMTSRLDPRIESAFPVLNKLNIRANELSEANEFEDWANSIVEGRSPELDKKIEDLLKILNNSEKVAVGADAMNIKGQLDDIIDDDGDKDQLYAELEKVAHADPDHDAKPVIVAWLQERSDDKFYGDVLDKMETSTPSSPETEPEIATNPAKEKSAAPAQPMPAGEEIPEPSPQDAKAAQQFMPQPLAEKAKKPVQRNFVAKHAQRSGAGSHGKKGFQRHDKHKKKLGEEGVAEGYSELDNLKKKFEGTMEKILQRAKEEGRPLTDREKKAIAILKGENKEVKEGSEWETRHHEFVTVGDRATPEQIDKIVKALIDASKQASGKRGFLNQIAGKQSNGDLARMAHGAETLAKNIQRNRSAKTGTDERKELGQHLVYAVSLLKRMSGEQGVAEGSEPQVGDEVYYGNRLVGTFKGYSKLGKIITEPNVKEMGDEYLSKDAYWDPKDITIKPKQGVAEGGILKSIKRGLQGWDKNAVGPGGEKLGNPRDIVKRAKAMDTDTAKKVRSGLDAASDHSPAGLQKRVLDRKLKDVSEGSENLSYKKGWKLCDKDPSADPQHLFRRHGEGLDRNQFIKGFNDNAKSRGMSIYGDVSGDVDHSTLRYKEFKRDQGVAEDQLDELKCWDGYKRVPGTTAGEPGSCEKIKEDGADSLNAIKRLSGLK